MLKNLIDTISKHVKPSEEDIALCEKYFEHISKTKNTILEKQDKIPKNLYFIISGFVRIFYLDPYGDEITTHLATRNQFLTSFLSFIHQTKTSDAIQCITDCELLRISRIDLVHLIDISENFKNFSLIIFEQAIQSTEKRANDLATLPAAKRYKKLILEQPDINELVPVQFIASYLGIKPESLSRIRRQLSR